MLERSVPSAVRFAEDPETVLPDFTSLSVGHLQVIPGTASAMRNGRVLEGKRRSP